MLESFCVCPTVTLEIDVGHPEFGDKAGGSIKNTVGDLPVHVHNSTIQRW
jgi:hypothetical protein